MSNVYGSAVHDPAKGGVAIAITKPRAPIKQAPSLLASELRSTGRWEEVFVPATKSTSHLAIANIYGVARASSDNRCYKENEAPMAKAIRRMIEVGDIPCLLIGDFNINPSESNAIASAVEAGIVVDVGYAARESKEAEATYRRDGPFEGMLQQESHVSRIDGILANIPAANAVKHFALRWDLVVSDHVPLEVHIAGGDFSQNILDHKSTATISTKSVPKVHHTASSAACEQAMGTFELHLNESIDNLDLDEAHQTWSDIAEMYIKLLGGQTRDQAYHEILEQSKRTSPPTFIQKQITAPTDHTASTTSLRQRQLNKFRNRCVELKAKLLRHSSCRSDGIEINQDDTTISRILWDNIRSIVANTIGTMATRDQDMDTPTVEILDILLAHYKSQYEAEQKDRLQAATIAKRAEKRWDWEHNHSRKAFRRLRSDYKPPTASIKDPANGNVHTFSLRRIHNIFMEAWGTVYRRHAREHV